MVLFKAVQIGCGGRAQTHTRALFQVQRIKLTALCDLVEGKARRTAEAYGVPRIYTDFREMMEVEQPDIVAFIAPPAIRSQVVLPVLEYRPKALIIEKPMAISLEEAEKMVASAEKAGTCFVICHQCRYGKEMVRLRDLLQEGRFGRIEKVLVNCKLNLMEQGTHILDLIEMLFPRSRARWVLAQMEGVSQLYAQGGGAHPAPDHSLLQIGYDDGMVVLASMGHRSPEVPETRDNYSLQFQVAVIGSSGYGEAIIGYGWNAFFADGTQDCGRSPAFDEGAYMTQALYEEVVDVLEGKKEEHQASAQKALQVHRLINSAYESSLQGRAISLPYKAPPGTLARLRHRMAANRPIVVSTLMYGHYPRREALQAIAEAGFQFVDLWMLPGMANHFDPEVEDVGTLKEELKELGLSVPMISFYNSEPVVTKLRVAHALGAQVAVTSGVNVRKHPEVIESLKAQLSLAQQLGLTLAFENHIGTLETLEDMVALLEALDHPSASICLAPTHLELCGQHPEEALAVLRDRISVIYLWDIDVYTPKEDSNSHWRNGDAQIPGGSDLDFSSLLTSAVRYAPSALWTFTWHGTEDWPLERITQGLIRARRHIERCRPLYPDSVFWR